VASYVGATTIREHVIGLADRPPDAGGARPDARAEVGRRWRPAPWASVVAHLRARCSTRTEELIELCKVAAEYRGKSSRTVRSEGNRLLESVDECSASPGGEDPAEIYHLKAAAPRTGQKYDEVIAKVEAARKEGLKITADMYTYPAVLDPPRRGHAALGAGRRLRGGIQAAHRPRNAPEDCPGHHDADDGVGEPVLSGGRPIASCSWSSRTTR